MKIPGWPVFYLLCGIAVAAIAVFVIFIANSTSFPPLDLSGRVVRAEARRNTHSFSIDSEQGKVMDVPDLARHVLVDALEAQPQVDRGIQELLVGGRLALGVRLARFGSNGSLMGGSSSGMPHRNKKPDHIQVSAFAHQASIRFSFAPLPPSLPS